MQNTPAQSIPERLTYYLSEINVLHPFREGNGRTQRIFIEYLAWHVDFSDVSDDEMIEASVMAFALEYEKMISMFRRITTQIPPDEQKEFRIKIGLSRPAKK